MQYKAQDVTAITK